MMPEIRKHLPSGGSGLFSLRQEVPRRGSYRCGSVGVPDWLAKEPPPAVRGTVRYAAPAMETSFRRFAGGFEWMVGPAGGEDQRERWSVLLGFWMTCYCCRRFAAVRRLWRVVTACAPAVTVRAWRARNSMHLKHSHKGIGQQYDVVNGAFSRSKRHREWGKTAIKQL